MRMAGQQLCHKSKPKDRAFWRGLCLRYLPSWTDWRHPCRGWPAGMTCRDDKVTFGMGLVSPSLKILLTLLSCFMRHKALGFPVLSNSGLYKQTPTEFTHYNCVACSLLLQQQKMVLDSHTLETLVISKWSWLFFSTEKSVHSVLISILWTLCSGSRQRLPRVVSLSETEADQ